ncbi:MAG: hypothetical protein IPM29_03365 [Planctomycetes bacterium]|nr:hypothetical protein [Planctomycetota bacterium]
MSTAIDFLPPWYRERLARRRARRQRLLMAIPIVLGLVLTDLMFRFRIRGLQEIVRLAEENAELGERRGFESRQLAEQAVRLQRTLDAWLNALAAPRMIAVLDEVLATQPEEIVLQQVNCHLDPTGPPTLQIDASCDVIDAFSRYQAILRASSVLPPLQCRNTDLGQVGGSLVFRLATGDPTEGSR